MKKSSELMDLIGDKYGGLDCVDEHSSMLLVRSAQFPEKILIGQYDSTYPKEFYRFRVNLIGGAEDKDDKNPRNTLERELNEEFSYGGEGFAPEEFIGYLREEIKKRVKYQATYESFFLSYPGGPRKNYSSIDTVYISEIDDRHFKDVANLLDKWLKITKEGNVVIAEMEKIVKGDILTAWDTGKILADIYKKPIPNPDNVFCRKLNIPEILDYKHSRSHFSFKE